MIKKFYKEHEALLKEHYPALTLARLEIDFFDLHGTELGRALDSTLEGVPLEYLSKRSFFYKSEFYVDESVLIPRGESEILVEKCVGFLKKEKGAGAKVLEVGVGSGALVLSLLQELDFKVEALATDICESAINVAKKNYYLHNYRIHPETDLKFKISDRLHAVDEKFDLILSNPPYIKEIEDRGFVHKNVIKYEPHVALFIEDSKYRSWFEKFFIEIFEHLTSGGLFFMEGHENHLGFLKKILGDLGFVDVEVIKDYTGRNRFLKGMRQ